MFKPILLIAALAIAPLTATAGCPGEGSYRSISGDQSTSLTFVNAIANDEEYFAVYWLDYDGNRKHYADVFPGQSVKIDTYMTHPWLVTLPIPGGGESCDHIYLPTPSPARVVLR